MRFLFLSLVLLLGCSDKGDSSSNTPVPDPFDTAVGIEPEDTQETAEPEDTQETQDTEEPIDPNIDEIIDATDSTVWIHFDLESGSIVSPTDPANSEDWDVAFQRYAIAVNGGVSGSADVAVMEVAGMFDDFENVVAVPADGTWMTDLEDADGDDKPEYAFQNWFNYDISTHVLTPADVVYLVRTAEENIFRFRIIHYYSAEGESGYMNIEFDQLER